MDLPPEEHVSETPQPMRLDYQNQGLAHGERLNRTNGIAKGIVACLAFAFCASNAALLLVVFINEHQWKYPGRTIVLLVGLILAAGGAVLSLLTALQFLFGLPSLRDLIGWRRR